MQINLGYDYVQLIVGFILSLIAARNDSLTSNDQVRIMIKNGRKIDTLTSLRFIAAMMVIFMHSNGTLQYSLFLSSFNLSQGVSLFFVLSGFIMVYVYPELSKENVLAFFKSRFARIWPVHIAALGLILVVIPPQYVQFWGNRYHFLTSCFMIGSWIPLNKYFALINIPSWSIGTECFFYLCFPLLIYKFYKTWHIKLAIAFLLIVSIIFSCKYFHVPIEGDSINVMAAVYINPLSRLFEFILGMSVGFLFNKMSQKTPGFFLASLLEIVVFYFVYMSLRQVTSWYQTLFGHDPTLAIPTPAEIWVGWSGGSCIAFACLIFILAFQKGIISSILRFPIFILLGEISYSMYLIHYTFLSYYGIYSSWFNSHFTAYQELIIFMSIILSLSYLMWRFVEVPCRRWIINVSLPGIWRKRSEKTKETDNIIFPI